MKTRRCGPPYVRGLFAAIFHTRGISDDCVCSDPQAGDSLRGLEIVRVAARVSLPSPLSTPPPAQLSLSPSDLRALPIFPLPNAALFPGAGLPLHVFEPRYRHMVRDALAGNKPWPSPA